MLRMLKPFPQNLIVVLWHPRISRPCGTYFSCPDPALKVPGYYQLSLRRVLRNSNDAPLILLSENDVLDFEAFHVD